MEGKSISCIIGALLINLTLGTFYSISNVIPYIASYMRRKGNPDVTTEHGAWITATFLLGQGLFIIAGSLVEQKFNSRIACILGCVLHSSSTFLAIWALDQSFLIFVLIYGLGSGLGCGSAYMASIIAAQKWFPQSKGIVTGIIVAGFGLGGLIFTNLQTLYINPDNEPPSSSGYFGESVYNKVPNLFLYMGLIFAISQTVGCFLAYPAPETTQTPKPTSPSTNHVTVSEDGLPNIRNFLSVFKFRIFYLIGAMMMLVAPGVTFVNSLGKRYGQAYIDDDRYLATVVAIAAVANALGRLTWGLLIDKFAFSTCFTIKVLLFSILIILFPFSFILESRTLYLIWMMGLFFGFSGTFVLFPVFIEQVFGDKYHGIIYGTLYLFLALASILASFVLQMTISTALKESRNPDDSLMLRLGPCMMIATLYICSLVLYVLMTPVARLENAIRRKREMHVAKSRNTLFNRQDLYPLDRGTLAERTDTESTLQRENSLGSIVRFREVPHDDRKLYQLPKLN